MKKSIMAIVLVFLFSGSSYGLPMGGLVAHYPFDNNANDDSGYNNNGTVSGAVFTSGVKESGLRFDGIDDYVRIPNTGSLNTSTFTVSFWWNFDHIDNNFNHDICYSMIYKSGNYIVQYYPYNFKSLPQQEGPTLRVWIHSTVAFNDNILLEENHWYHVVATYDQSILKLFLDGQQVASETHTTTDVGSADVYIGADVATQRFSAGIIDEVYIYNRALSEPEIQALYAIISGFCTNYGGDTDGDGICDDGNASGVPGDAPCTGGETENCDDNCPESNNPDQADSDNDGIGNICDNICDTIALPQTGQTTCYDSAGNVIACPGTGQDGDVQAGVIWPDPRFEDNGDGTITDHLTGLIWLKDANRFGQRTWSDALNDCNTLAADGVNLTDGSVAGDWHLPNIVEMESLVNAEQPNPAGWLSSQGFSNAQSSCYWSSSTGAGYTGYAVWLSYGYVDRTVKSGTNYVWPVRGGQGGPAETWRTGQTNSYAAGDDGDLERGVDWPLRRFTDNNNGTVTDNLTGLIWLKNAGCLGRSIWSQALRYCNSLASGLCGLTDGSVAGDWRLPNRKELFSLIDYSHYLPALSQGHPFTGVQSSCYQSSSTRADSTDIAWHVGMDDGHVFRDVKSFDDWVWPVRGGLAPCADLGGDTDGDGVCDDNDGCPTDPDKTEPGECGCGVPDTDSDGDGTPDCNDLCPNDPNKIAPGVCGCGFDDSDLDGDGTPDCNDECPDDPNKSLPGLCGCGVADTDTDSDGTPDCNDNCPADPDKTEPGICGCGMPDIDTDGDGALDCNDNCPNDPNKIAPGVCGCNNPDADTDDDTIADCIDNCPTIVNPDQTDTDEDGIGDACETQQAQVFIEEVIIARANGTPVDDYAEFGKYEPVRMILRYTITDNIIDLYRCKTIARIKAFGHTEEEIKSPRPLPGTYDLETAWLPKGKGNKKIRVILKLNKSGQALINEVVERWVTVVP